MKLISLNIWGSSSDRDNSCEQKVLDFLTRKSADVDIFCLQEAWSGEPTTPFKSTLRTDPTNLWLTGLDDVAQTLQGYSYLVPDEGESVTNLAIFYKKTLNLKDSGSIYIDKGRGYAPDEDWGHSARMMQYATIESARKEYTIMNLKGLWRYKAGKVDLPERIEQSEKIINFIQSIDNPFAIVGDFNLTNDTKSVKMLEAAGLTNLIRKYGIRSTRTSYYEWPEKYADYIFTGNNLDVKDFRVLPDEVSDHAPMHLEFE